MFCERNLIHLYPYKPCAKKHYSKFNKSMTLIFYFMGGRRIDRDIYNKYQAMYITMSKNFQEPLLNMHTEAKCLQTPHRKKNCNV